jgi:hypothetical protein
MGWGSKIDDYGVMQPSNELLGKGKMRVFRECEVIFSNAWLIQQRNEKRRVKKKVKEDIGGWRWGGWLRETRDGME